MVAKRNKGLGKGLGALFDDMEVSVPVAEENEVVQEIKDKGLSYIDINDIKPNSKQPRQNFDKDSLQELADSIKTHGLIQPITVRNAKRGYELVAGERRWRAARLAGLSIIPSIIKDISDEENVFLALIENMQREDLNPLEEAEALKDIMDAYSFTQNEVAQSVGKSRAYVANLIRLLNLPKEVRACILAGQLTGGHGKAIAMIQDYDAQVDMAKRAVKDKLSVHDIEKIASGMPESAARKKPRPKRKNKEVKLIEDELTSSIGAKVAINASGNKGKVELYYYSEDELNDLIDILRTI